MHPSSQGIGDTFFVEQRVEWQFAFDIHCNAFFILFIFLYVVQVSRARVCEEEACLLMVAHNISL